MVEPRSIDVATPIVALRALTWGPDDAPICLCLHGFPGTAYGWRVVAPFMRGYAPSSIAGDRSYAMGAVMDDALRVLDAVGPTGRDVIIGHDWGAYAANGLAAMPGSPFGKAVLMSLPPVAAFLPRSGVGLARSLPALLPGQSIRSWYIAYFHLPRLPERSQAWILPFLWRRWSPGYDAGQDLEYVRASIGPPENWRAALATYRAAFKRAAPPQYSELHRYSSARSRIPSLYLHGVDDGCMTVKLADRVAGVLPDGSAVMTVDRAGHFLQLERPDVVAQHIVDFVGRAD